jgi:hypothetical protein
VQSKTTTASQGVATRNAARFIQILTDRESDLDVRRKASSSQKCRCTGYMNAEELSEAGGRGPLERGRQSRSIGYLAEPQVGHARQ